MKLVKTHACSLCGGDIISDRVTNNLTVNWAHPRYEERRHLCPKRSCRHCGSLDTGIAFTMGTALAVGHGSIKAVKVRGRTGSHVYCNVCKHDDYDHQQPSPREITKL